ITRFCGGRKVGCHVGLWIFPMLRAANKVHGRSPRSRDTGMPALCRVREGWATRRDCNGHIATNTGSRTFICYNRAMPTVVRSGPYRFYFYSHEPNEPPHIHVDRDDLSAKFWVDPVQLAANFGFRAHELRDIQLLVAERTAKFLEAWNEFFGSSGG
ncbi:MAG: DUF4160 domain-containing protein, partial [Candidatus Sulfotelmatobacter sp.]